MEDLVQDTDEGRGKQRKASASCMRALNRRYLNETSQKIRKDKEPRELKRLST